MTTIFVYGSLREGMYNYDRYLKDRVQSIITGYVKGSLYEIKGVTYPALIPGENLIVGEIMEIEDDAILTELDEMEGYLGEGNIENEYNKTVMDIYNEDQEVIHHLPVYLFNLDNPKHRDILGKQITCNDYVLHMKQKSLG